MDEKNHRKKASKVTGIELQKTRPNIQIQFLLLFIHIPKVSHPINFTISSIFY